MSITLSAGLSVSTGIKYGQIKDKTKEDNKSSVNYNANTSNGNDTEIDALQKQKQNLQKTKQKISKKALEKGESQQGIQVELQDIDKQIAEIDKQISEIQLEKQREMLEKNKQNSDEKDDNSKADGEDDKNLKNLIQCSSSLSNIKTSLSQKKRNEGEANVLKYEVDEDKKKNINTEYKEERIDNIKDIERKIGKQIGGELEKVRKAGKATNSYKEKAVKTYENIAKENEDNKENKNTVKKSED
ncbi:V-type ATP synthase subunit I domain-containing protein [Clostridium felsineum]|uniref:Uncharacterized protein n=1 Tax=Clostridium felsineum TaxID=36839 RepID=A0A1S8LBE3_9CLOT|nr:hypothetical protein [Clostridium felsineum]URZ06916.1 hypothetical protein CLROS_022490 [Clostridium felsineum]URZ11948.1 hypothetical protein CROST_026650 [Clostridium felsineum]